MAPLNARARETIYARFPEVLTDAMKVATAMLDQVLVDRCGVEAEVLTSLDGSSTIGTLFEGWRSRLGLNPLEALQKGLNGLCPEVDWHWVHEAYPLDELRGHVERVISFHAHTPERRANGATCRVFQSRHPDAQVQDCVWQSDQCFVLLAGIGGQKTGGWAAALGLLGLFGATVDRRASLRDRLIARARAMDDVLRRDKLLTGRTLLAGVAILEVIGDEVGLAHCGAPLVLRARGDALVRVSADHGLEADLRARGVEASELTKGMMARGLGWDPPSTIDLHVEARRAGDRYCLLSTRGFDSRVGEQGRWRDPAIDFQTWTAQLGELAVWEVSLLEVTV